MRRLITAICVLVCSITLYSLIVQAQQLDARIEYAAVFPDYSLLIHVSVPQGIESAEIVVDEARFDLQISAISQVRWLVLDASDAMLNLQPAAQTAAHHFLSDTRDTATGIIIYNSALAVLQPTDDVGELQRFLSNYAATANEPGCLWDALAAINEFERDIEQAQRILVVTSGLSSQDDCERSRPTSLDTPVDMVMISDMPDQPLQQFSTQTRGSLLLANLRTVDRQLQEIAAFWSLPVFALSGTLDELRTEETSLILTLIDGTTINLPIVLNAAPFPEGLATATPTVTATATEVLATLPPVPTTTPSPTITPTSTVTPSPTATFTPSATFTATPTSTFTSTPTETATVTYTHTATATFTPTATATATDTATATSTSTPTPTPTDEPTEVIVVIVPTLTPQPTPSPTPVPDTITAVINSIRTVDPLIWSGIALLGIGTALAVFIITRPHGTVVQPVQRTTSFYENLDTQVGNRATIISPTRVEDEDVVVTAALAEEQLRKMAEEAPEATEGVVGWLHLPTPQPQYFELRTEGAVIGRSKESQIVIKGDLFVSRQHARLRIENEDVYIENMSARNPVLVNNVPVTGARRLSMYDVIQLSPSTQLVFIARAKADSHE